MPDPTANDWNAGARLEGQPPVRTEHFVPNPDDPGEGISERTSAFRGNAPRCIYLNPIATVTCEEPTAAFFLEVRKQQGRWCRLYKRKLGKAVCRSVKDWAVAERKSRCSAFWDRSFCYTGLLLIDGDVIPPHEWPDRRIPCRRKQHRRNPGHPTNAANVAKDSVGGDGNSAGHAPKATNQTQPTIESPDPSP